jgi:transporter family protein
MHSLQSTIVTVTTTGVGWGLLSALALGVNSILVAISARRVGVLRTTGVSIVIAFALLVGWALVAELDFDLRGRDWLVLSSLAAAAAAAFLASYRALQLGPLAVVSPVSATNGLMTVVFAFAFIGERPSTVQWCGIPVAAAGAVLASLRSGTGGRLSFVGAGPLFAVIGVATGAISNAGLRVPIREIGPVQAILVQRAFTIVYIWLLLLVVVVVARGSRLAPRAGRGARLDVALHGTVALLDAVSFLTFARGLAVAPAWLIGMLSQSGRAIAVVGGVLLFRERLAAHQWGGIALLAGGLVLAIL